MKPLTVFAFCLLALALSAVNLSGNPNQGSAGREQCITQGNLAEALTKVEIRQNGDPTDATKNEPPHGNVTTEDALVVVGIITFIVIGWQSYETRRAATAAKESAKAAELNAQAFINSERPWIVVEPKMVPYTGMTFRLQAANVGRTPAEILWDEPRGTDFMICDDDDLPDPPPYGDDREVLMHRPIVGPGEEHEAEGFALTPSSPK